MLKVIFKLPDEVEDSLLKYAVIVPRYNGKFVFSRKRGFDTWEIPGGHREDGETIEETARRELYEETGITDAVITKVNVYGVVREEDITYGLLCFAEVNTLGTPPLEWEMEESRLFDSLPKDLTYPLIHSEHFWRVQGHLCTLTNSDEVWDVYDENRQKTGRLHRRGDMMPKGEYHLVVHIWLMNSRGEFLLTKRAEGKGFAGMWECTGGSAVAGDDSLTAALREMKEETGLTLDPENGKVIIYHGCADNFCDIWLFREDHDLSEVVLQPGETVDAKYASRDEVHRMYCEGELVPFDYIDKLLEVTGERTVIRDKSCGAVVFADQGDEIRYMIIRQTNGVRCFPKGHMEEGETEEETAIREIKEETGIDVTLVDGFCEYDNYRFTLDDQTVIDKDVVYFLGRITSGALVPQEGELEEIQLLPFDEAYEMLQFDRSKDILKQADELIRKNR